MDIVAEVLQKAAKDAEKFKTTDVEKHLELELDLGTLLVGDINQIEIKELSSNRDEYLRSLARDNTQVLFNALWQLPTERVEEAIMAKLPKTIYVLPREHVLPKPKPLTKWERFAKEKNIVKTKKPKLTYDEVLQKWIPTHGYKRAAAEKQRDWALPVPQNADPMEDQFAKRATAKTERVAKNELHRLKNIAAAKNVKVPKTGLALTDHLGAKQLHTALTVARSSTASLGKFQAKLPKEKDAKKVGDLVPSGRKRKQPMPKPGQERQANIAMVDDILRKKPRVDLDKAVNREIFHKEQDRAEEKKGEKPRKERGGGGKKKGSHMKGGKGGGKGAGKRVGGKATGGKRPTSGQGKRGVRPTTGRKRR